MKAGRFFQHGLSFISIAAISLFAVACNSKGGGGPAPMLTLTFSTSTVISLQDGTPAPVTVTVGRPAGNTNAVTLSAVLLPGGVNAQYTQPGTGNSGTITFRGSASAPAGTYSVTIQATDGTSTGSQDLVLVVAIVSTVGNTMNTAEGVNGRLEQFMATSFQVADWSWQFFQQHPDTTPLNTLGSQHIRLQVIDGAMPMKANTGLATDWNFTEADAIVQPVLAVTDHSPEFQIGTAPNFLNDANGHLIVTGPNLMTFAQYCANLVSYYNKGGFTWGGTNFHSPSVHPIIWWGIFNEYNINGLTPAQYVQLYDAVVPAMLAVDPTIKISAMELSDYDYQNGDPRNNVPTFVSATTGATAQVDIVSTHFYSSCNQKDTDMQLLNTIPSFVNDVVYIYSELKNSANQPRLATVPVWVTENNVNADYSDANGNSTCTPAQKFTVDQRGSNAFFAAWRPYVFSQLGKAGNQAFYHWAYPGDAQYGEVDQTTGSPKLSYWVDYWLPLKFPWNGATPGPQILQLASTETSAVEVLATRNSDNSVVVMLANHAVHAAADDNGTGDPRTIVVDVSSLGAFSSATQLTMDATTNAVSGPFSVALTPSQKMTVTLPGYGVTFITLKP